MSSDVAEVYFDSSLFVCVVCQQFCLLQMRLGLVKLVIILQQYFSKNSMPGNVVFHCQGFAQGIFCQFSKLSAAFAHVATPVIFAQALLINADLAQYCPFLFGKAPGHALKVDQRTLCEAQTEGAAKGIFAERAVER